MNNCYALLFIKHKNTTIYELVDLGCKDYNIEGVIEFIIHVYKIKNFNLYTSPLDFNTFKELFVFV